MRNSRELVLQAINHQRTVNIPKGELVLDDGIIQESLQSKIVGFDERYEFVKKMGLDMIVLSPTYPKEYHGQLSIDIESLDIAKWANTDLFSFVILDGAFELGMRVFGVPEFLSMAMSKDDELETFISQVEKTNKQTARILADKGINGIIIADDIAYPDGLFIRPSKFRDQFLPTLEHQVKAIEEVQIIPFFHSDGYYISIIEDIIGVGFKGIHCIDRNSKMHLKNLVEYADKLCLWGHLDFDHIENADEQNTIESIAKEIKDATDFKGFILGTNSGMFTGMDVQKLKNIYDKVEEFSSKL